METFSVIPSPKVSDSVVEPHLVFHTIRVLQIVRTVWMGLQVEQHAGPLSRLLSCSRHTFAAHEVQRCPELSPVGGELR